MTQSRTAGRRATIALALLAVVMVTAGSHRTLAAYQDGADVGASLVTAGELTVVAAGAARVSPGVKLAPGGTVVVEQDFEVTARGDGLVATLAFDTSGVVPAELSQVAATSIEVRTPDGEVLQGLTDQLGGSNGAKTYTVRVEASLPADAAVTPTQVGLGAVTASITQEPR
jgi:alternate signal-mediated exported protein